jgi:hypothetical protein
LEKREVCAYGRSEANPAFTIVREGTFCTIGTIKHGSRSWRVQKVISGNCPKRGGSLTAIPLAECIRASTNSAAKRSEFKS